MSFKRFISSIATILALIITAASCGPRSSSQKAGEAGADGGESRFSPRYAAGFVVRDIPGGCLVDISDPQGEQSQSFRYLLYEGETPPDSIPQGYLPIHIPVESIVCMTSLQLSNFLCIGETSRIVGITSTKYLFSPVMRERLESGLTRKIGIEGNFDSEVILALNPGIILISPFKRGGYEALKGVDIPLIPHLGYKETTPLGQAEWIKFAGLLSGCPDEACRIFEEIEGRYNELKAKVADVETRPVVLSGELHGGNWYVGGGRSFLAQIFRDAGGDYFLPDDNNSGGLNLDFESVYSKTAEAGYWRIVNSYDGEFSYEALRAEDARYADLGAFKNRGVIYCNMRLKPFYELMPVQPDVVLADLIHIFHPGVLPQDYTPVFYELLK